MLLLARVIGAETHHLSKHNQTESQTASRHGSDILNQVLKFPHVFFFIIIIIIIIQLIVSKL